MEGAGGDPWSRRGAVWRRRERSEVMGLETEMRLLIHLVAIAITEREDQFSC